MSRYSALVRRRRDGRIAFDLDLVHAGVVVEALEQTRQVLLGESGGELGDGGGPDGGDGSGDDGSGDDDDGSGDDVDSATRDEFDAIVAGLGDLGAVRGDPGVEPPDAVDGDPVLRRLLPDAFLDDAVASEEFRRLTGDSVRGRKVTAIDSTLSDLALLQRQDGGVVLEVERARAWLTALNDARLALGTRLALGEDDDLQAELDAFEERVLDPESSEEAEVALRAYRIAVYDFLSGLLDMVVRALDR